MQKTKVRCGVWFRSKNSPGLWPTACQSIQYLSPVNCKVSSFDVVCLGGAGRGHTDAPELRRTGSGIAADLGATYKSIFRAPGCFWELLGAFRIDSECPETKSKLDSKPG